MGPLVLDHISRRILVRLRHTAVRCEQACTTWRTIALRVRESDADTYTGLMQVVEMECFLEVAALHRVRPGTTDRRLGLLSSFRGANPIAVDQIMDHALYDPSPHVLSLGS
jgi:hypothetical protein